MRKFTLLVFCMFIYANLAIATTYYVSSSTGNDANNGLSTSSPWKSLSKVNSMMSSFLAGDNILFKTDDVFRGQITVTISGTSSNPIKFGAYGTGAKPLILGSEIVNNWSTFNSSIQKSNVLTFANVFQVYVSSNWQIPARFPNGIENFLSIDTVNQTNPKTTFGDSDLATLSYSVAGATCASRTSRFNFERRIVGSHAIGSNQVTMSSAIAQGGYKKNWGYFLYNKFEFLDAPNEWYYNTSTKQLYLYGSSAPSNVEATVYPYGVYVQTDGATDIIVENISFKYQQLSGVAFWRNNNRCIVQDCDFDYAGETSINAYRVMNQIIIRRNNISNPLNKGIGVYNISSSQITNNQIQNCGIIPGFASANPLDVNDISLNNFTLHNGTGISVWDGGTSTTNNLISENVISNTCYSGIQMRSYNSQLTKNSIVNYCKWLDDGGGLYFRFTGNMIQNNFVKNGIGNLLWTTDSWLGTSGLYLDDLSSNNSILNNTSESSNTGLYIHNSRLNTIFGNTLYNNNTQLEIRDDDLDAIANNCDGNTVTRNVLYSLNESSKTLKMYTSYTSTSLSNMGSSWDSNYFFNPYSFTHINRRWQSPSVNSDDMVFWQWKSTYAPTVTYNEGFFKALPYIINTEGSNLILNGDMNLGNPPTNWRSYAGVNLSSANNNLLTSFCLGVNNSSANLGMVYGNSITLQQNQFYHLSFSVAGAANGKLRTFPLQSNITYANKPDYEVTFPFLNGLKSDFECIFQIKRSTISGSEFFANELQFPTYYLDNVKLTTITATADNLVERSKLYTNYSSDTLIQSIPDIRYTIDNVQVSGTVSIPPYSSVILIKKDGVNVFNATSSSVNIPQSQLNYIDSAIDDNVSFHVYNNVANISIKSESTKSANFSVYTLNGIKICTKDFMVVKGLNNISIPFSRNNTSPVITTVTVDKKMYAKKIL